METPKHIIEMTPAQRATCERLNARAGMQVPRGVYIYAEREHCVERWLVGPAGTFLEFRSFKRPRPWKDRPRALTPVAA